MNRDILVSGTFDETTDIHETMLPRTDAGKVQKTKVQDEVVDDGFQ